MNKRFLDRTITVRQILIGAVILIACDLLSVIIAPADPYIIWIVYWLLVGVALVIVGAIWLYRRRRRRMPQEREGTSTRGPS